MKRKRVSAADVAKEAGVSRTTVSFVLNNTPGKNISEATRQRVVSAAQRLGYTPNEAARTLAMSRRRSIGLFICHSQFLFTDVFIARAVEGMTLAVNRLRVRLVIHPVTLQDTSYLTTARRLGVEGIVLINTHDNDPGLEELCRSDFPTVAMDYLPDLPVDQVFVDGCAAAHQAVAHISELGHRRIGMIAHASPVYGAARFRIDGYRRALEQSGLEFCKELLRYGDFSERSGYDAMKSLLELEEPPTAVFAGNDVVAYGAMQAVHDAHLSIPGNMSLVGFDDDYLSRFLNPPLTTVVMPATGMGSTAVNLLVDRLEGRLGEEPSRVELPTQVAVRDSAAPPE
jgi:LacI family transcriptional regulator